MMTLDNGTANGKSDSHTIDLSCVESFEKSVHTLGIEADARILHGKPHLIVCVSFRFDLQLPGTIIHGAHSVRSVLEQVQNDLLKLDTIPCHRSHLRCCNVRLRHLHIGSGLALPPEPKSGFRSRASYLGTGAKLLTAAGTPDRMRWTAA